MKFHCMRQHFCLASILFLAGCQLAKDPGTSIKLTETVSSLYDKELKPFYHVVAYDEPLTDRVIIWTRITPDDSLSSIEVSWEIASNDRFDPVLKKATVTTSPTHDYTVKVDVDGL